jgi:CHAD domain-containing protein
VRSHVERELKLVPGEGFRLADLGEVLPARTFVSAYHDTADFRLSRRGITLRHRVEDGARLWQLKIPTGAARIELELGGPPARPPEEMTALLVALLRGEPLLRVARLRTRRESVRRDGAEIVEDSVSVLEAQRVTGRFRELEIELFDGDEKSLRRVERSVRKAGAEPSDWMPKLHRALGLVFETEPAPPAPDASPLDVLGRALVLQHRSLLDHDPGTRLGVDPEDLHQMRVATRRARAFLRVGRPLVDPGWDERLRAELGWLGSALGPARDADVLLGHLRGEVDALGELAPAAGGLVAALERERARARKRAVAALSTKRYFALLDRLETVGEPPAGEGGGTPALADLWWKELGRTRRAFAKLGKRASDEELHAARIRVKRARYAAELAGHELGKPGRRFVAAAKRVQDVLGEHQDSVVAEEWILAWNASTAEAREAAARLVERQRRRRAKARREWPDAWTELERSGRRARG